MKGLFVAVALAVVVCAASASAEYGPRGTHDTSALMKVTRRVYFDVSIDGQYAGRIVMYV